MTILNVRPVKVRELLTDDSRLRIPPYQRPYSWAPATARRLFDDIADALASPSTNTYVLGSVILHQTSAGSEEIVDGQQRLITLTVLAELLQPDGRERFPGSAGGSSPTPLSEVVAELQRAVSSLQNPAKFKDFMLDKCELVRVTTDSQDEAFRIFDSQNYRGKTLRPHDLLKAHHLREMRDETAATQAAVVERWEDASDDELDLLFSAYLYRIACWSEGRSAPGFSAQDIGMFKGVSTAGELAPSQMYHVAAQTGLPMLGVLGPRNGYDEAELRRARFQLTAPIVAGKPFFEMVDFMREELANLSVSAFSDEQQQFSYYGQPRQGSHLTRHHNRIRYRYVTELYLSALLLCLNKLGRRATEQAKAPLFHWAYSLRTQLQRVQYRSVDNMASGKDGGSPSPFVILRSTTSVRDLLAVQPRRGRPNDLHEQQLNEYLTEGSLR